jgi:peptide-methionine (R)-S-oxide reductase
MEYKINKTDQEWKKLLTEEQYRILREKGTERPFTGKYDLFFEEGMYTCAGCGQELFVSDAKFNSGCGWPAFDAPMDRQHIEYKRDLSHGMVRVEILCSNCGGHLGHVFNDGPTETGERYCVNSASLDFKGKQEE